MFSSRNMKGLMMRKIQTKLGDAYDRASLAVYGAAISVLGPAAGLAQDADPTQPLEVVKKAREAARKSTLAEGDVKNLFDTISDLLIYGAVPIGLFFGLLGFFMLHTANQDDSGRSKKGPAFWAMGIGMGTMVFSVILGVGIEYFLGTKT